MKGKANNALWQHLLDSGVLETGDKIAIANAKKEWRRNKDKERKRRERAAKHEHIVALSLVEEDRIANEAQKHGQSISNMVRVAALAYLDNAYIPSNVTTLYHIEALVKRSLTAIEQIAQKDKSWLSGQRNYSDVKEVVQAVYELVKDEITKPKTLDNAIVQMAKDSPAFRQRILNLLQNVS